MTTVQIINLESGIIEDVSLAEANERIYLKRAERAEPPYEAEVHFYRTEHTAERTFQTYGEAEEWIKYQYTYRPCRAWINNREVIIMNGKVIEEQQYNTTERIVGNFDHNGRKIITHFDHPPIPARSCDWSAVFDDYDGAEDSHRPIGRGATEKEAVQDLIEQVED